MGKQVMVVDDSRITKLELEKFFEGTDYEIVSYCKNGEDAVAHYDEVKPDLVLMDIIMPGMDGLETAEILLGEHPAAKVVIMSSLVYEDTIDAAHNIGAKGFVMKPLELEQVLTTLNQVFAHT